MAIVLGVTSVNISKIRVVMPIEMAMEFSPKNLIDRDVIMDEMAILTKVLPARIVVRQRMGFSRSLIIRFVFFPSWAILFNLIESRENNAVSVAEKYADRHKKTNKRKNLRMKTGSIIPHPLIRKLISNIVLTKKDFRNNKANMAIMGETSIPKLSVKGRIFRIG